MRHAPSPTAALAAAAVLAGTLLAATGAQALTPAGEGRRLYLKYNCYGCHGMNGAGGMGPRLRGEHPEFGDVAEVVLGGSDEGMPSFARYMTSSDLRNLTTYLGTLGRAGEPTFTHWWEANPSR